MSGRYHLTFRLADADKTFVCVEEWDVIPVDKAFIELYHPERKRYRVKSSDIVGLGNAAVVYLESVRGRMTHEMQQIRYKDIRGNLIAQQARIKCPKVEDTFIDSGVTYTVHGVRSSLTNEYDWEVFVVPNLKPMSSAPHDRPFLARFTPWTPTQQAQVVFCQMRADIGSGLSDNGIPRRDDPDFWRWDVAGPTFWQDQAFDGWAELPLGMENVRI